MDKLQMQSKNLVDENIDFIAKRFPNCITEAMDESGKLTRLVDFDLLKQELSKDIVDGNDERYTLNWAGKKQAILTANSPINATLRPCREESVDFDSTKNLYIEGDNLDVLKLLRETYLGKVKMIYIDPPYNTGNDFVYEDDFASSTEDYLQASKSYDDQGNRMFQNNDSNGRFHSEWLSMMYSRLKLAKDLLTDDGTLFASIDDNEIDNLKKLCIEIFGHNNVEILIWNKEAEGSSGTLKATSTTRRIHEYIVCAFKNYDATQFIKVRESLKGRENELQTANLAVNLENEKSNHPNYFTITNPSGDTFTRQWKWNKDEIDRLIKENLIYWGSDGHKQPRLIIPTDERRKTFLLSILNYGGTTIGRKDFEALMGNKIEFSYPKPVILLKKLIETATENNSIVMDFFSGSATTAHAVMKLNAEDGGKRNFIMVQLPEICDEKSEAYKAGYKNICEIGKERIRRAGNKIIQDLKDWNKKNNKESEGVTTVNDVEVSKSVTYFDENGERQKEKIEIRNHADFYKFYPENLDIGFRVLKLDSSCMKDVYYSPDKIQQDLLSGLEDNIKEDRSAEDLLFQVMLDMGVLLSSEIKVIDIQGKKVFNVNEGNLVCCFDKDLTDEVVTEIAKMQPLYAVFRDSSMASDSVNVNFDQIFETYSPTTTRKVL